MGLDDSNWDGFKPYMMDKPDWKDKEKKILEAVEKGLPTRNAFVYAGLTKWLYDQWRKALYDDLENGVLNTPFVKFMLKLFSKDEELHLQLIEKAREIALEDDNPKMVQYLLDSRYKYSRKQEVEVSTAEDTTFNINIIESEQIDKE